jgi:hypothetical protein
MPRAWQRPRSKYPKCGVNLGDLARELQGKKFRLAGEEELVAALRCPSCKAAIVPLVR